jgi:hypothetical protein
MVVGEDDNAFRLVVYVLVVDSWLPIDDSTLKLESRSLVILVIPSDVADESRTVLCEFNIFELSLSIKLFEVGISVAGVDNVPVTRDYEVLSPEKDVDTDGMISNVDWFKLVVETWLRIVDWVGTIARE